MEKSNLKKVCALIQLDIDAVNAYEQALNNIDEVPIRTALAGFQEDHRRHIKDLGNALHRLGATPPEPTLDFKGFLIQGFTAIRSLTGTEGALKAMLGNEKLTTKTYEEALALEVTPKIKEIIQANYADEKRHLAYIKKALENGSWKKSKAA